MDEELDLYAMYGVDKPDEDPDDATDEEADLTDEPEEADIGDETDISDEDDSGEEEDGSGEGDSDDAPDPEAAHQQELERVRQEGEAALDQQIKGMNLVDPYHDNRPITNARELQEYKDAAREEKIGRVCKAAGLTREQFDELVGELPEVRAAKDAQEAAEAAEQAAQQQQARERLDAEIAEIRKLCPEVKDLEALAAHKSYEKVLARMRETGCGVLEAFKLENFDELMKQRAEGTRRQAARNNRGKDHLKGTTGKGKGGVSVPSEVFLEYKRYNPNATEAEITAHYARRHKN